MKLNKDEKVVYIQTYPYRLGNGQEVNYLGEELTILSDVVVQDNHFEVLEEVKKEKTLEEMNKEELIEYASQNDIEVDNRKGEKKLLLEIQTKLKEMK